MLYLVDGHALAYRSYYAFIRNPLTNSQGEETSAIFGFLRTVLELIDKHSPSHLAVVFDGREATFRDHLYKEYKAHRPEMPESLAAQLPRIFELLEAMAIPTVTVEGYEADDVIATVSARAQSETPVRVVSGDKDLFQIVSDRVRVIRPGKNGLLDDEIDAKWLEKQFQLQPEQFIEMQALMGDSTDNVPGVKGVGEKTALKLVQEHGSLDEIYAHLDDIKSKSLRDKLAHDKEQAYLSKKLVTLVQNVPLELPLDSLSRRAPDKKKLATMLRDLEFRQILESMPDLQEEEVADATAYVAVTDEAALRGLAARLAAAEEFAIDVESSSVDSMRAILAGISVALAPGHAWYIPITSPLEGQPSLLEPERRAPGMELETVKAHLADVLANERVRKIGQNIKYDSVVLQNAGFELKGISFDTMLASYCLQPARRSHGLDALAEEIIGHKMTPFSSLFDKRTREKDIREVPLERVVDYACEDADYTLRLKNHFQKLLKVSQVRALFEDVEMPLSGVLTRMEMAGVALDSDLLNQKSAELQVRLESIERSIYDVVGETFNINSTQRLQKVLFDKLGLKPVHKTKTGYSTDIDVLRALEDQHEVIGMIIEYRTLSKLKSTYIDALPRLVHPRTRRVHTSYNQSVATTGRLSSSDPNLQNIPIRTEVGREIRRAFIAGDEDRVLLDADYSQIELRIMAHLSKDPELIKAFRDDEDVHRKTAARILGVPEAEVSDDMRSRAKTVNFGIMYGMGARGLAQQLDIDVNEAKQFIEDYFNSYPGVRRFINETIERAKRDKAVTTLLGRVRPVADIDSSNRRYQSFAQRIAVNTPIQGTAADIIKVAMVNIDRELQRRGLRARMILQVHDELMFELPKGELPEMSALVREQMEGAIALDVPLKVDMGSGQNWLEAH